MKQALLGENIEELHDMRVATRRMRSAFDIFSPAFDPKIMKRHLKGLRTIGRVLGQVRDMDVILENALTYQKKLKENQTPWSGTIISMIGRRRLTSSAPKCSSTCKVRHTTTLSKISIYSYRHLSSINDSASAERWKEFAACEIPFQYWSIAGMQQSGHMRAFYPLPR